MDKIHISDETASVQTQLSNSLSPETSVKIMRGIWFMLLLSSCLICWLAYNDEVVNGVNVPFDLIVGDRINQVLFAQSIFLTILCFILPKFIGRYTKGPSRTARGFAPLIVRLSFAEAISILGFVCSIRIHSTTVMIPFAGLSLLLFLLSFPTRELMESFSEK